MSSYFENKRVLTVGEGSMGFSAALSRSSWCKSVTASTWDTQDGLLTSYEDAARNLKIITTSSNQVIYEVDATKLDQSTLGSFDLILWNFPHVPGKANNKHNRALIDGFLQASQNVLKPDGKCIVTLCPDQSGWHAQTHRDFLASWKLSHYAAENGYLITEKVPLEILLEEFGDLYYPVGHRGSGGKFSAFRGSADVFILSQGGDALQAPMYSHELHVTTSSLVDIKWLEREVRSAIDGIYSRMVGDIDAVSDSVVWSCQVVDLYLCPRTRRITTAIEVAYCSTTRALGRATADSIRLKVEGEIARCLNDARRSTYFKLRPEKLGGRVSQPHFWRVAQKKKYLEHNCSKFTDNLSNALRSVEHEQDGHEALQTIELLSDDNLSKTSSCRGGDPDIEVIRSLARGLWKRRLGVIIKEIGNEGSFEGSEGQQKEEEEEEEEGGEALYSVGHKAHDTKWNLYLLQHEHSGRTYLGITTDMERRLRQHNGLLSGGSKYTRAFRGTASVASGEEHFSPWKEALVVKGLSRSRAMALEAQIKIESKKKGNSSNGARESHTTRASQRAQLVLSRITDCERGRTYVKTSLE